MYYFLSTQCLLFMTCYNKSTNLCNRNMKNHDLQKTHTWKCSWRVRKCSIQDKWLHWKGCTIGETRPREQKTKAPGKTSNMVAVFSLIFKVFQIKLVFLRPFLCCIADKHNSFFHWNWIQYFSLFLNVVYNAYVYFTLKIVFRYVLPNHMLLQIAEILPKYVTG